MKIRLASVILVAIAAALLLVSCGGGGGGGSNGTSGAPQNNWDSMVWDQGTWQ